MSRYSDCRYNVRKTILGVVVTALYCWLGIRFRLAGCEKSGTWICTEAILNGLAAAIPEFGDIERLRLDHTTLGFATTSDFFRIARGAPGLIRIVR